MNISGADDHQLLCWTAMMVMIAIGERRRRMDDGRWTRECETRLGFFLRLSLSHDCKCSCTAAEVMISHQSSGSAVAGGSLRRSFPLIAWRR